MRRESPPIAKVRLFGDGGRVLLEAGRHIAGSG
jgi:hypothetical protein